MKYIYILLLIIAPFILDAQAPKKTIPKKKPSSAPQAKPIASADGLLDSLALSKKGWYTDIFAAIAEPNSVYKLRITNANQTLDGISKLKNLQVLEVKLNQTPFNEFGFLNEIVQLKKLTHLTLSGIGVHSFSANIGNLKHLKHLDLSNNPLIILTQDIAKCQNLQTLDVSNTELMKLPDELSNLKNLKTLATSAFEFPVLQQVTSLTYYLKSPGLPEGITKLSALRKLTILGEMPLDLRISQNILLSLQNLDELYLPDAMLNEFDLMALNNLRISTLKLGKLRFSKAPAPIGAMGPPIFQGMQKLKYITFYEFIDASPDALTGFINGLATLPFKLYLKCPFNSGMVSVIKAFQKYDCIVDKETAGGKTDVSLFMSLGNLNGVVIGKDVMNIQAMLDVSKAKSIDFSDATRLMPNNVPSNFLTNKSYEVITLNTMQAQTYAEILSKTKEVKTVIVLRGKSTEIDNHVSNESLLKNLKAVLPKTTIQIM